MSVKILGAGALCLLVPLGAAAQRISKSVDPDTVFTGETAEFTIVIDNTAGTSPLGACKLLDPVPACMTLLTASCSATPAIALDCGVVTPGAVNTTAAPFGVAAGVSQTIRFSVTAGSVPGPCLNSASIDCDSLDDRGDATLEIEFSAQLSKEVAPASIAPGGSATFTITIDNGAGTDALTDCKIIDPIDPACLTLDTTSCGSTPAIAVDCGVVAPDSVNTSATPFSVPAGASQEISFDVTAVDGPIDCLNRVSIDCNGGDFLDSAEATLEVTGGVSVEKTVAPASVGDGDSATFTIVIDNAASAAPLAGCRLVDKVEDCVTLAIGSCTSTPSITLDCGVTLSDTVSSSPFMVPAGGSQVVTLDVTGGSVAGPCPNEVTVECGSLTGRDDVTLEITPDVFADKSAAPAVVAPGGRTTWTIVVDNSEGGRALSGCVLSDPVDVSCMTLDTASCVATPAVAHDCGVIKPNSVNTEGTPFGVAAGGTQTFTFEVTALAMGECFNVADVTCDGGFVSHPDATLTIDASSCDLVGVDITYPPVTPARSGAWVYTNDCGAEDRLDDALVVVTTSPGVAVDTPDDFTGTGGSLRLYQLDCGCGSGIYLVKNPDTDKVQLSFF